MRFMSKNTAKIQEGIRTLVNRQYEIISGTIVPGSLNISEYTVSVQPTANSEPIEGVMLSSIAGADGGFILFPADGSNVVIGSVDGPGEWALMKASEISRARITIGNVVYEMDETKVSIQNGSVIFNMSDSLFKLNTAGESLFQLLKDCITYITELTVPTPSGTSGVPINALDFTNLLSRLNNLITP
jgi:phage gp45-like